LRVSGRLTGKASYQPQSPELWSKNGTHRFLPTKDTISTCARCTFVQISRCPGLPVQFGGCTVYGVGACKDTYKLFLRSTLFGRQTKCCQHNKGITRLYSSPRICIERSSRLDLMRCVEGSAQGVRGESKPHEAVSLLTQKSRWCCQGEMSRTDRSAEAVIQQHA
jgi:hypothetical protein